MEKPFNPNYPLQEHLSVDVTCEILEFPAKTTKKCQHQRVSIDSKANELECRDCGVKVNAVMWIRDSIHYFKALQERSLKDHNSLVVSHLSKMKNNCIGQELSEPIHTMTTVNQFAEVRAFLTAFYGNEKDGNSIGEPLRTIPTRDRFGLVTVGQQQYQIVDIGFRMLQPVELFKAQGFPDSYIFEKGLDEHGSEIRLTKTEQTRMVGNSVCPQLSRALVEANFKHESKYRGAA